MSRPPVYWNKAKKFLSKNDKIMKKLILYYKKGSLVTKNDIFFSLCKSIIGQQISVAAANAVFFRFKKKCNNRINAKTVSNLNLDEIYEKALNAGALGGKLLGAGGGGYFLFFAKPKMHKNIKKKLHKFQCIDFDFSDEGSKSYLL